MRSRDNDRRNHFHYLHTTRTQLSNCPKLFLHHLHNELTNEQIQTVTNPSTTADLFTPNNTFSPHHYDLFILPSYNLHSSPRRSRKR